MYYTATFFSHGDAVRFSKKLALMGVAARLMPVPRQVSSSCGTAARFETDEPHESLVMEGLERIFLQEGEGFHPVYEAPGLPPVI